MTLLLRGDALAVLRTLQDESIDAIVTDPPYGLSAEPDAAEVLRHWLAGDDYAHRGGGFMGKSWDSFVPGPATWTECLRVLKPGGHLLAFAGSRTMDLMGMAIRLAGFEMRDTLTWMYGCLTDDAEVLTEHGWKLGVDVEVGERVAQWDPESEAISLAPIERKYLAPWDGPMRVIRNADTDQVLTPNHRVWHRTAKRKQGDSKRRYVYGDDWAVAEADQVTRSAPTTFPLSGFHGGEGIGGEDYAALLGWVWTEGGFDRTGTGVRIYQSPSANPGDVKEIDALIERLGIGAKRYERERIYRHKGVERPYTEVCWFFTGEWAQRVRADLPDKHPTWSLLWAMDLDEKYAFYEAAMRGDGSKSGTQFWQNHEGDLEWFQALLHLIGKRGRITMRRAPRSGGSVAFAHRGTTEMQHRHFVAAPDEHYTGMVWCVGVPTGAFVARRNGKVFVTGNSGFPKSLDVSKAIDKMGGDPSILNEMAAAMLKAREDRGLSAKEAATHFGFSPDAWAWWDGTRKGQTAAIYPPDEERAALIEAEWPEVAPIFARLRQRGMLKGTKVHARSGGTDFGKVVGSTAQAREVEEFDHATDAAKQWEGWGTALKPAYEPIIMARKPLRVGNKKATVATNVLTHGTGALNIDATRIGYTSEADKASATPQGAVTSHSSNSIGAKPDLGQSEGRIEFERPEQKGRWPANVLLTHHEDCTEVGTRRHTERIGGGANASKTDTTTVDFVEGYERGDGWVGQEVSAEVPVFDCHDDCPVRLLDEQTGTLTSGTGAKAKASAQGDKMTGDSFGAHTWDEGHEMVSYADKGGASRFFYSSKTSKRERNAGMPEGEKNNHPTVKPVEVMRWLVKMVTPPGGTVLDPYVGSGTTGIAAVTEGFEFIGIDRDDEDSYLDISEARITHWAAEAGIEIEVERREIAEVPEPEAEEPTGAPETPREVVEAPEPAPEAPEAPSEPQESAQERGADTVAFLNAALREPEREVPDFDPDGVQRLIEAKKTPEPEPEPEPGWVMRNFD